MRKRARFLILKTGAIGDLFFALPALRALSAAAPECEIEWVVSEGLAPLLGEAPEIRRIVPARASLYQGSALEKAKEALRLRRELAGFYDRIFLLHRSAAYLPLVLGKGPIFQMARHVRPVPGVRSVVIPPLSLQESLAIRKTILEGFSGDERKRAEEAGWHLATSRPRAASTGPLTLGVHLGGGVNPAHEFRLKRWPYFPELISRILAETPHRVLLVGSASERAEAEKVLGANPHPERIENRVGGTDLPGLVREISRCDLFIGPDSGPLHIADSLEIPAIGLYGPTSPVSWGLLGARSQALAHSVPCQPCYRDDGHFPECANGQACMTGLQVEGVMKALLRVSPKA